MHTPIRLYRLFLLAICSSLFLGCQTWDLPTRKTQRQCTAPAGQLTPLIMQLQATLTIIQPTGTINRIDWDFGDGKTQSTAEFSVVHPYAARGEYSVKATMTNLCGQSTILATPVKVSDVVVPTVTIQEATNITKNTATLRMTVTSTGKGTMSEYGVYYSKTNPTPTEADLKTVSSVPPASGGTPFTVSGLEPRVTYYMRAYGRNEANPTPGPPSFSSEVKTFRTLYDPILTLSGTPVVSRTSATVGFTVADQGNPAATQYGIVYSATSTLPDITNSTVVNINTSIVGSNIAVSFGGLTLDRTYSYRAFARNADGTITYGPVGTFSTIDIASDLVIDVPFTNQSLLDQSGNNNNAYPVGAPTYTTDHRGNPNSAILLNGTSQWFYFIDNTALRPAALTISFWINARSINTTMQLYNKSQFKDSSGEQYSSKIVPVNGGPTLTITNDVKQNSNCLPAQGWQTFTSTSSFAILNNWTHVVFTYEGRTACMYLNGTIISKRTDLPNTTLDNCAGGDLKFGAQIQEYPQFFNGAMDDVRVYRRALTPAQIEALKAQ